MRINLFSLHAFHYHFQISFPLRILLILNRTKFPFSRISIDFFVSFQIVREKQGAQVSFRSAGPPGPPGGGPPKKVVPRERDLNQFLKPKKIQQKQVKQLITDQQRQRIKERIYQLRIRQSQQNLQDFIHGAYQRIKASEQQRQQRLAQIRADMDAQRQAASQRYFRPLNKNAFYNQYSKMKKGFGSGRGMFKANYDIAAYSVQYNRPTLTDYNNQYQPNAYQKRLLPSAPIPPLPPGGGAPHPVLHDFGGPGAPREPNPPPPPEGNHGPHNSPFSIPIGVPMSQRSRFTGPDGIPPSNPPFGDGPIRIVHDPKRDAINKVARFGRKAPKVLRAQLRALKQEYTFAMILAGKARRFKNRFLRRSRRRRGSFYRRN